MELEKAKEIMETWSWNYLVKSTSVVYSWVSNYVNQLICFSIKTASQCLVVSESGLRAMGLSLFRSYSRCSSVCLLVARTRATVMSLWRHSHEYAAYMRSSLLWSQTRLCGSARAVPLIKIPCIRAGHPPQFITMYTYVWEKL